MKGLYGGITAMRLAPAAAPLDVNSTTQIRLGDAPFPLSPAVLAQLRANETKKRVKVVRAAEQGPGRVP